MSKNIIIKSTNIFKLISDPTRFKIIKILLDTQKDVCVNEIAEMAGVSHSATSHQLAKLEAKNIVTCFRVGRTMCYKIKQNQLARDIKKAVRLFN